MPKLPAPVKFLSRLLNRTQDAYGFNYAEELKPWRLAAIAVHKELKAIRAGMPGYTPKRKRGFYGTPGTLRNPHHPKR